MSNITDFKCASCTDYVNILLVNTIDDIIVPTDIQFVVNISFKVCSIYNYNFQSILIKVDLF